MKTINNKFKLALAAIALLAIGTVNAQQTSGKITKQTEVAPAAGTTGSIRLIDNKGTIKYLQAANGITMLTNDGTGDVTTTTWQLGGTLTSDTYIDANGKVFGLDGLTLVTDISTASTDATSGSDHGTGSGFTVLIRDEATGEMQKIKVSDLLQVQSGQTVLPSPVIGANVVTGLPANYANVSVYRNGAKLIANDDYTVAANALTLVDKSAATPPTNWTLYSTDVIEVHWVK
ncbi:hypothetical protein [Tenacibaculum sp. UWU-22]|uniref:hypothetical protein n=1 Tax=Tenacibaculum sp. UWU-22 TaxID=3234187 RepID=UPI0034DB29BC